MSKIMFSCYDLNVFSVRIQPFPCYLTKNQLNSEFSLFFMEMSASVITASVNVVKSFQALSHSMEEFSGLPGVRAVTD